MVLRKETKIFVQLGFTDMRKQINGLSAIVQRSRPQGPFEEAYYVFCGKTKKVIKILYWDKTEFCLWLVASGGIFPKISGLIFPVLARKEGFQIAKMVFTINPLRQQRNPSWSIVC